MAAARLRPVQDLKQARYEPAQSNCEPRDGVTGLRRKVRSPLEFTAAAQQISEGLFLER